MWRHMCMGLSQETLIISLYPLSRLPPSFGSIHLINSTPQVKISLPSILPSPALPSLPPPPQCSPSLRSIHLINSAPQVKFPSAHYTPPFPPSPPPPPAPLPPLPSLPPPLQCLTFIGINTFDQFHPQVKFPSAPSAPPSPPSLPSTIVIIFTLQKNAFFSCAASFSSITVLTSNDW